MVQLTTAKHVLGAAAPRFVMNIPVCTIHITIGTSIQVKPWADQQQAGGEPSLTPEIHVDPAVAQMLCYEEVLASLADFLKENGPFDGLCGFDMGACLAFDAARLAQEGDLRFEEKFRYLILFSGRGHRELAEMSQ
ncbi:unnamed protein product, partial [Symbiodinium sp. KB8]